MATAKTYRPEQLAATLGMKDGKALRSYLRRTYKRPASQHGADWNLTQKQTNDTLAYFRAKGYGKKRTAATKKPVKKTVAKPDTSA